MPDQNEIWVLGHGNTSADKSFSWWEKIPNITDADIIILDLSTLPPSFWQQPSNFAPHLNPPLINRNYIKFDDQPTEYDYAQEHMTSLRTTVIEHLEDKILGGGHVIYLLHHNTMSKHMCDNEKIIPFNIKITKIAEQTKICYTDQQFKEYLKEVKNINYILNVPKTLFYTQSEIRLDIDDDSLVTDKSKRMVGAAFTALRHRTPCGYLTFLPSPSSDATAEMVDIIVSKLRGYKTEPPPSWINDLEIVGLNNIKNQITDLELEKNKLSKQISKLEDEKKKLNKYSDLLYATGNQLEEAVRIAFVLLGFDEINNERGIDNEDWRIEFKSVPNVKFGVIEVKGRNKKTTRQDIVQCNTWVDDYFKMNPSARVKGIFVPNQFRRYAFPKSKDQRKCFEPNEISYAKTRNICIIPSYVLFESANRVLSDGSPDRNAVEELIFNTNGVLERL